ncbi:PAS domain-containing protein [Limnohabitans sp. G3-2]|uniref:PAS domain-containing protein n=1 Tax=Limnohabitans sp. G3-2 TaxID=1100711 RepID=UPI000C1F3DA4|nr:PAS domain-containing protein [Limnohabitans sp. G3-2]PIT72733.1 aerotaxis receptor Aer [Limnohabitans sp. G3-2]
MKYKNTVPTSIERVLADDEFIISKTDTKGKIIYGNRQFNAYSGFSENELLGVQHNIVRHPDMPRAVFKLLWDEVQAGREVFAFVKNLSKDGSFYWVFANVTPSFDMKDNIVGYFSVRRKPKRSALPQVADLYQRMLSAERQAGPRDAIEASTQILRDALNTAHTNYEDWVLNLQNA